MVLIPGGPPLYEQLTVQVGIVRKEHGHGSVNQLPSHSHAPRASDTANHPEVFDQGRPFVNTDALQKLHDGLGKSLVSFFCHTRFSKENQVHDYMHARIKFHAYSVIKVYTETVSRKKEKDYQRFTLYPRNEGSKHHRQSTGGCVRLAPATSS
jgi:hypothetical protein